jgi:hypothetical protein
MTGLNCTIDKNDITEEDENGIIGPPSFVLAYPPPNPIQLSPALPETILFPFGVEDLLYIRPLGSILVLIGPFYINLG